MGLVEGKIVRKVARIMSASRILRYLIIRTLPCIILILGTAAIALAQEEIVVCNWGGEYAKTQRIAYFDPFEKETGIKVKSVSVPEFAKIKAMVTTGNLEWDVVIVEERWVTRGAKEGLFEPIDYTAVDIKEFLPDSVHPYGVMSNAYAYPIVYNTNKFSEQNHPRNWTEFWDIRKFPGRRSLYNNPAIALEQALLADGTPPDKLYPLDVDRAFKSLDKIKPYVSVWFQTITQAGQLMATQEVDLISASHARTFFLRNEGVPVQVEMNQAVGDKTYFVVLKGTKHKATSMRLINYITRAKPQADWVNLYAMGVTNRNAYNFVKPEILPFLPTSPKNMNKVVWLNSQWWVDNEARMFERWNEWMLKK
jgi:putative spermidine/putrescine transport system substrate-binding protein